MNTIKAERSIYENKCKTLNGLLKLFAALSNCYPEIQEIKQYKKVWYFLAYMLSHAQGTGNSSYLIDWNGYNFSKKKKIEYASILSSVCT